MVAQRHGQTAARNMLGAREAFDAVPFFWSQHYDVPINYVGHAEKWDEIAIDGNIKGRDCMLRYKQKDRVLAVASIYRDVDSLRPKSRWRRRERAPGCCAARSGALLIRGLFQFALLVVGRGSAANREERCATSGTKISISANSHGSILSVAFMLGWKRQ